MGSAQLHCAFGALRRSVFAFAILAGTISASTAFAGNGSVTYTYDALGRVTSASYDTGVVIFYAYDANGNRTQQTVNVATGGFCWATRTTCGTTDQWNVGLWQ